MKYFFLFCFWTYFFCSVNSQNYIDYYNQVNKAEFYYYDGQYIKSAKLYKKAFRLEKPKCQDYCMMALCMMKLGNAKKCTRYLIKSSSERNISTFLSKDTAVLHTFLGKKWQNVLAICESNYTEFTKNRDSSDWYKEQLKSCSYFIELDQEFRSNKKSDYFFNDTTTIEYKHFLEKWIKQDSLVQCRFIEYIENKGFPTYGGDLMYNILLHFDKNTYEKAKPILLKELRKGNIEPFFLGMTLDRLDFLLYGKSCQYGIWNGCTPSQWDIVIKNRLSIGQSIYFNGPRSRGRHHLDKLPWYDYAKSDISE